MRAAAVGSFCLYFVSIIFAWPHCWVLEAACRACVPFPIYCGILWHNNRAYWYRWTNTVPRSLPNYSTSDSFCFSIPSLILTFSYKYSYKRSLNAGTYIIREKFMYRNALRFWQRMTHVFSMETSAISDPSVLLFFFSSKPERRSKLNLENGSLISSDGAPANFRCLCSSRFEVRAGRHESEPRRASTGLPRWAKSERWPRYCAECIAGKRPGHSPVFVRKRK